SFPVERDRQEAARETHVACASGVRRLHRAHAGVLSLVPARLLKRRMYRVVQWATGSMGRTALRRVIDHPDLELVGVYVYDPRKVGVDAGEIARRPPTGV